MRAFSLQTDPFPDGVDRRFYFDTPALEAQQNDLSRLIDDGDVLIVDEKGSGKSTALQRFVELAGDRMRIFVVRVPASQDARALSNALVAALGLPLREPVAAELRDADAFLELVNGRGDRAVIVIDDAERLERGALEQLLYLRKRWEHYDVRFLMAAQPELCERLDGLDAADRLLRGAVRLDMPRFDQEQIGDYLNLCLYRAGLSGDSPFDAERVARITAHARGLVGAVNPAARALLNESLHSGTHRADGARRRARRWSLAFAVIAMLGVLGTVAFPRKTPVERVPVVSPSTGGVETGTAAAAFRSSIAPRPRNRNTVDAALGVRSAAGGPIDAP